MNRYVARARRQDGFTLIELLVVIAILAILAGIVIFAVGAITDRGTSAACKTDLKTIETAVEAYRAKNGSYPANLVPTLTSGSDQFLRWDNSFPPSTSATGPASSQKLGNGYTIDYQGSATGDVWVNGAANGTCPT
jgi:prepilin-type N-terminal cleavage/methylation domain-containing protein